ncbi:MAG: class I SAM-dependent methyltransferase [Carnobacterium sp.]|uniref:Uncharacterized methyltransferase ACFSBK_03220 n=1 Tax=Carnobacterium antarcticum TaxID=2126436 RepID=A0ABW4NM46_9LACT|nr:class I SAM-dependent methyltransferase [Carnobacterium sp. CP1]ALV22010.1 SAM-dependent methyltransferase YrrT [Carnobacterium sp. CP1]
MGREFLEIFSDWSEDYDEFVEGKDPEYQEVFKNYDRILNELVSRSGNSIIEFGIGTGNLTLKLLAAGKTVFPIEPSREMREAAQKKLPTELEIIDGDLQKYPKPDRAIDTMVSSYVFHHLTDKEKALVLKDYALQLEENGKVVFADTMFKSKAAFFQKLNEAKKQNFYRLAEDLEREYYPIVSTVEQLFEEAGFDVDVQQMNDYVWIVTGTKK